ncbi:MAG: hypothetical protein ACKVOM_05210 [Ferruginibacter sp.]
MLNRLSKYQQEIALSFMSLFLIGGIIPLKANANNNYAYSNNYGGTSYRSFAKVNLVKPAFSKENTFAIPHIEKPILMDALIKNSSVKKEGIFDKITNENKLNNKPFIGGPGQPEMGAFKPVGADNMVDLFSGDMSYNIPLLDVGGYPVNIFYNSGITMDQEASWAGLGWNINPGTIMRNMRGVPDDFNGTDLVTKTLSMKDDKTWGVGVAAGLEIVGFPIGFGGNLGLNYNNQRGISTELGLSASGSATIAKFGADEKTANLSLSASLNLNLSSQGGATFTPSIGLSLKGKDDSHGVSSSGSLSGSIGYNSRVGLQSLHIDAEVSKSKTTDLKIKNSKGVERDGKINHTLAAASVASSNISFAYPSVTPSIRARMSRMNISASIKIGTEAVFVNPSGTLNGFYSQSRIADEDKVTKNPAYGVMYYQNGNNDPNALLDFNRLQDGVFTKNNPTIAIPTYSYDVFSISGEGVGGSFRAYRGDLGYVHDAKVTTRDDAGKVGFDIGIGPLAGKGGVNLEYVFSPTTAGSWEANNIAKNMLTFKKSKDAYQAVYFKNPGEKTIPDVNFQNAVGGEDLVRLKMAGYGTGSTTLLPTLEKFNGSKYKIGETALESKNVIKNNRDKRTQIITCLNAEEASRVGFDTTINSYNDNPNELGSNVIFGNCAAGITKIKRNSQAPSYIGTDKYRKAHHISEINVLGGDGRKYVYGIPVYNTKQIDATFNIANGDNGTMQSNYSPGNDDGLNNQKHKDWYIEKEEMPAYTHSFLLTELVSPNYVDLTNNGVSEDDMGDAVKFNYSQLAPIKWRTPTVNAPNIASYSEGLKTYSQDDKAHYTYGEREQWYLYSVESKNMVAKFYVENDRRDGKQVLGMHGGLDVNYGAQRLSKISLFSKADLVKLGANAKPIKTVHLEYDYSLCPNTPTNSGLAQNVTVNNAPVNLNANKGKLTLRSIYFTYNGNERSKKNKYTFHYPADKNPSYQYTSNDRWGNYKPSVAEPIDGGLPNNLGGLSNADFPYSIQNKIKADKYAGAWVMDSIGLPSGGKIKINYETDDYAYVQNRRAAVMYNIAGFGETPNPTNAQFTNSQLYTIGQGSTEYEYIYATLPFPISTTQSSTSQFNELQSKYFSNFPNISKQIMVKLMLPFEPVAGSSGYIGGNEMVAMYADVESFGLIATLGQTKSSKIFIKVKKLEKHTPMVQYALQFAKNSLPGAAFPGSVNDGGLVGVIKALGGMLKSFKELTNGVDNVLKGRGLCKTVVLDKSFIRLSNPYFTKYGGGLRVKKVTISDNWDKMTGQAKSTYGQEYKYTKQELINGKLETISSGVASWEPAIGGEENPHREMMTYYNHNKGGPFDYNSVELPLAEMFFPSANVGYSHVEVLPLHRDTVKNAVGKSTTDFFTTRDFPTKSDNTFLEDKADGGANFYESPKILQILHIKSLKSFALSQGFKVDLNDMNGKIRRQESLGANGATISSTENYYNTTKATNETFKFNHFFPTVNSPNGKVEKSLLGRDIEVMTDLRNHNSQTISANININIDVQVFGVFPVVLPPIFSPVFFEENDYKSASMLKVVNHFGMLDSVVVIDKGSQVSTKNLLYDAETGNVLLTRTNNEYDKPVYNFTYPAHWAYSGMGPAYQNIDVLYDNLTFRNGIIENPVQQGQTIDFKNFESGDELYVYSPLINGPLLTSCDQGLCALPKNQANRIWAINTNKTGGPDRFTFMDAQGNPYNAMQVNMRIIRSGHRNMLEQMVGGITSLQSPIVKTVDGKEKLEFNDATGIIQTSAATFKDHWRVDDAKFLKEVTGTSCNPVVPTSTIPVSSFAASAANLAPSNDEICNAVALPVSQICTPQTFSNVGATTALNSITANNEYCYGSSVKNADVWFTVVVPPSGFIKIATSNGGPSFVTGGMSIYAAANNLCTSQLTLLSCPDDYSGNMPKVSLYHTPGATLYIRIYGNDNRVGNFDICATTIPVPINNECSNATLLPVSAGVPCNLQTFGTTYGATQSINAPVISCETTPSSTSADDDVWYKFIATRPSERITLTYELNSSLLYGMRMVLYSGNCGSLTELQCVNGPVMTTMNLSTNNTTYYIRVMTDNSTSFYNFKICITQPPPPVIGAGNGTCANAFPLVVESHKCQNWTNGTTIGTSHLPITPTLTCDNPLGQPSADDDVWYSFVANNNPSRTVYIDNSSTEMILAVYNGLCNSLTQISCARGYGAKINLTGLIPNGTYFVRVMTVGQTTQSNFRIRIDEPPFNDTIDRAIPITVNNGSICEQNNYKSGITFGSTPSNLSNVPTAPCLNNSNLEGDVWYTFQAKNSSHQISADYDWQGNGTFTAIAVYSGTPNSLTLVKCSNLVYTYSPYLLTLTNLTENQTYYVRVLTNNAGYGSCFKICITTPIKACETATPFCLGATTNLVSPVGQPSLGGGDIYGCLNATPNPTWYYLKIADAGNIKIKIRQTTTSGVEKDVDFALWGPFNSVSDGCNQLADPVGSIRPISCAFSQNALETAVINNAISGKYYILLVTNYSGEAGNIAFSEGDNIPLPKGTTDCCITTTTTTYVCTSRFSNALINPYVEGVYGNWRADTTYSYYGTRKETDPSIAVDIRTGGTITGYKDFWNFNPNPNNDPKFFLKRNYTANREWAWNSTSTQFNRKGYETENKDPLGRFNAGVYGYNQQLPIAVANNARLREVMFDGFEDYDYKTENSCSQAATNCAIPARHAIFKDITSANLSTQEHHTGQSSLIVSPGTSVLLGAEVKSATVADAGYGFNMNVASQQCPDTLVKQQGKGYTLTGNGLPNATNQNIYVKGVVGRKKKDGWLQWEGYILPTSTGYYDFRTTNTDDKIVLNIFNNANPTPPENSMTLTHQFGQAPAIRSNFKMIKGQSYRIVFRLTNGGGAGYQAALMWRTPDMKCSGLDYAFIPTNQVYDNGGLGSLASLVTEENRTVLSLNQSQASGNKFNDKFSPLQNTKMVLSAWVKESADCKCSTYVNNAINLNIDGVITILKPTGNIIEGWQRYETYFDIPNNAQNMSIALKNTGASGNVFFDDVRIHPFNANEKTFVYHSSNLRLMAELDENNYASFYEYDDDGTLTRVKKETQRGIKTITETRSALYKQTQ